MPKIPDAHVEARRSQILRAAASCYVESGFLATQMRDIADRAGLSVGLIYTYFPNKRALLEAVMERFRASDRAGRAETFGDGPPLERLRNLAAHYRAMSTDPRRLTQFRANVRAYGEALVVERGRELVVPAFEEALDDVATLVREGQDDGSIDPDLDPRAVATSVLIQIIGVNVVRVFDDTFDPEAQEAIVRRMIDGMAAP